VFRVRVSILRASIFPVSNVLSPYDTSLFPFDNEADTMPGDETYLNGIFKGFNPFGPS
jgi:hypothetical protein